MRYQGRGPGCQWGLIRLEDDFASLLHELEAATDKAQEHLEALRFKLHQTKQAAMKQHLANHHRVGEIAPDITGYPKQLAKLVAKRVFSLHAGDEKLVSCDEKFGYGWQDLSLCEIAVWFDPI